MAPLIAARSAIHWYAYAAPATLQVPAVAVSVDPTFAAPVTFGTAVLRICTSLKWTNPLGQPLVAG